MLPFSLPVFLAAFLPQLDAYLKNKGIADVTYFHISDEPDGEEAKKNYLKAKKLVKSLLPGYKIMDAISHGGKLLQSRSLRCITTNGSLMVTSIKSRSTARAAIMAP